VLAEIRHPQGNPEIRKAVAEIAESNLYISVITIGEISKGIALLPDSRKKHDLTSWLEGLCTEYKDRLLPIDREIAQIWGEITARAQLQGEQLPLSDGLIASTALCHGLHVMTRNTRHFQISGALIVDPWSSSI
jgi:predicted nucleic acid-binding protein